MPVVSDAFVNVELSISNTGIRDLRMATDNF